MSTHRITAAEAYNGQRIALVENLNRLNELLAEHMLKQKTNPRSWGYVGDLAHWNELIERITKPEE